MRLTILIVAIMLSRLIFGIYMLNKNEKLDTSNFSVIEQISKDRLKNELSENPELQLVDVRKSNEWEKGNICSALNIDYFQKDFVAQFEHFDKEQPIYLYCRSGNRSGKGARLLSQEGLSLIHI